MATTGGDPARGKVTRDALVAPTALAMATVVVDAVIVTSYLTLDPAGPSSRRLVNAPLVVGLTRSQLCESADSVNPRDIGAVTVGRFVLLFGSDGSVHVIQVR